MQPELKIRKTLGRSYMNENRLAEALDVFSKILNDYPNDLETIMILGDIYLASGDGNTAKTLYLTAKKIAPESPSVARQIALAMELADDGNGEPIPTDAAAIARLLQRLTGKTDMVSEEELKRAVQLFETIITSENPADVVAEKLDEIDELLPALIEINIRQAYADGRPDLADGLQKLKQNMASQMLANEHPATAAPIPEANHLRTNVLMLVPNVDELTSRMSLLKNALENANCQVALRSDYLPNKATSPNVVIASNPHINPNIVHSLAKLTERGIPGIVDLDAPFELQPISHPEYTAKGLGTQARSDAYTLALSLAQVVTTPSQVQANALKQSAKSVQIVHDGWSYENKLWQKEKPARATINLGWVGNLGQLEDLIAIRRYIVRVMREFPQTRMVIIGNPQAYRLFESLPENRRLYLPLVAHTEFPYLLSQLDLLLAPLRSTPYNLSLPDTLLMEASAKGVPWLASKMPEFVRWAAGGILEENFENWHPHIRQLVTNTELRNQLAKEGLQAAQFRENERLGKSWADLIAALTSANIPVGA
jgi:glycosyltransferase involved in cell wall biosynthesis